MLQGRAVDLSADELERSATLNQAAVGMESGARMKSAVRTKSAMHRKVATHQGPAMHRQSAAREGSAGQPEQHAAHRDQEQEVVGHEAATPGPSVVLAQYAACVAAGAPAASAASEAVAAQERKSTAREEAAAVEHPDLARTQSRCPNACASALVSTGAVPAADTLSSSHSPLSEV